MAVLEPGRGRRPCPADTSGEERGDSGGTVPLRPPRGHSPGARRLGGRLHSLARGAGALPSFLPPLLGHGWGTAGVRLEPLSGLTGRSAVPRFP